MFLIEHYNIPCIYDNIVYAGNGYVAANNGGRLINAVNFFGGDSYIFNKKGVDILSDYKFDCVSFGDITRIRIGTRVDYNTFVFGYIGKDGSQLLENKFYQPLTCEDSLTVFRVSDKKDGKQYLYQDGQKISDYYDWIYAFKASLAIVYNGPIQIINNKKVCKGGLYGIIDITGSEILPCKYKSIRVLKEDRHYNVRDMNNKCYLINNNLVISDYYDWISKEGDGYLSVYKGILELQKGVLVPKSDNGLRGVINSEGDVIIPLTNKYQLIGIFSRDRAVVKMNDKYGFIDTDGRVIVPCEYSYVEDFPDFIIASPKSEI